MLLSIISRTLKNVIIMKIIPSMSKAARACCQEKPMAWQMVKAKKALRPMLGACAKGSLAITAMSSVAIAEAMAVAVKTAGLSMPVELSMAGFTANM